MLLSLDNYLSCRKVAEDIDTISNDEYEVYSAVLLQSRNLLSSDQFVIEQFTSGLYLTPKPSLMESETTLAFRTTGLEMKQRSSIIKDFILKNTKKYSLENRFSPSLRIVFISKQERSEIFSATKAFGEGWSEFSKKYPHSKGFIQFSRVGFNTDRDQAIVYCGESTGSLSGAGHIVLLVKEKNKWILTTELRLWIA